MNLRRRILAVSMAMVLLGVVIGGMLATRTPLGSFTGIAGHLKGDDENRAIWQQMKKSAWLDVYAINPGRGSESSHFNKYGIVATARITNAEEIRQLADLMYQADVDNDSVAAACFSPRHALRFHGGWAIICFECMHFQSSLGWGHVIDRAVTDVDAWFERHGVYTLKSSH